MWAAGEIFSGGKKTGCIQGVGMSEMGYWMMPRFFFQRMG